jgi:uncharacterized protein DUF4304
MNKNAVHKHIWSDLAPLLSKQGFTLAENTARHFSPSQIHVIGLQWFGPALAKRLGCTANSFAVRLGCYFRFIPSVTLPEGKDGQLLPEEAHCHIRKTVFRSFKQPECDNNQIWFVDTAGKDLPQISSQLQTALVQEAFPWFQRFSDLREAVRTLTDDVENEERAFGFGRPGSPVRHLYRGYIALELGDKKLATADLSSARDAGCFGRLQARIESTIELIK